MQDSFVNGDVVILKSGGDTMTVERVDSDEEVACVWSHNHKVTRDIFPAHVLVKYDPSGGWGLA
jgi:uncharacterized protein YodC (DUF2158 family)